MVEGKGIGMKTLMIFGGLSLALLGLTCTPFRARESAAMVFQNGVVYTVDPARPWAEAVAIQDGRIIAVGSGAEIQPYVGEDTEVFDLSGSLLLPGFIDSHTHFLEGGFALAAIQLRDAGSREEFIARIQARAEQLDPGVWILNGDWDHTRFQPPELPVRQWIDAVTTHNPVCVNRLDGHMVFVNSLALSLAGITKDTPAPLGGEIVKDAVTGEPTGILKDAAISLVSRHIPPPSHEEKKQAARAALKYAASLGVTSVHDMSSRENFAVYRDLFAENALSARLCVYIPISEIDREGLLQIEVSPERERLKMGGLKGFVDGSLGSSTALFCEPYTDNPKTSGILDADMYPEGIMSSRILKADRQGLQVAIHAIGDLANRKILDAFEGIIQESGERDRRWRVEHAQHLRREDILRFGRMGILASVQPYHAIDDGRWAETKIGSRRAQTTFAFRSLLEKGARLVCGSDWTVAPMDPLAGIYAAVTRRTLDGEHPDGWIPQEKIPLIEAVRGFTINGAFAEFAEQRKGSIEVGKLADLVVIDRNIFEIPESEIIRARVMMTVMNGRIVYRR
jgi:predicted amidohydrolase YtcJ